MNSRMGSLKKNLYDKEKKQNEDSESSGSTFSYQTEAAFRK